MLQLFYQQLTESFSNILFLPPTLQWAHLFDEVIPDLFIGDLVLSLHDGLDLHQFGRDCTLLIELAAQKR